MWSAKTKARLTQPKRLKWESNRVGQWDALEVGTIEPFGTEEGSKLHQGMLLGHSEHLNGINISAGIAAGKREVNVVGSHREGDYAVGVCSSSSDISSSSSANPLDRSALIRSGSPMPLFLSLGAGGLRPAARTLLNSNRPAQAWSHYRRLASARA